MVCYHNSGFGNTWDISKITSQKRLLQKGFLIVCDFSLQQALLPLNPLVILLYSPLHGHQRLIKWLIKASLFFLIRMIKNGRNMIILSKKISKPYTTLFSISRHRNYYLSDSLRNIKPEIVPPNGYICNTLKELRNYISFIILAWSLFCSTRIFV